MEGLAKSGVKGIMVDVWWGLCEPKAGEYNWEGYLELAKLLKDCRRALPLHGPPQIMFIVGLV